jgi:hypothetical protein
MLSLPKKYYNQGQILLSILIAIAIFSILAHALFTLIASSFDLVSFNKSRITARHLAQEKIELIRNLPYEEVATIGGIPGGTLIPQVETVYKNGLNYTIKTDIVFVDDPYDGLAPEDSAPEDYKRVRVEVSWEGIAASRKNPIVLISDISAEVTGTFEGGTLVILAYDSYGNPVPQAEVTIVASAISPPVNLTQQTNSQGRVSLPGATECIECYEISVTKSGMNTDRTYSTSEVANPFKPHASVFQDDVTQVSFAIDTLGSISIKSVDSRENNFAELGNVPFKIYGNKIIGTDASAQLVHKYNESLTTNSSGDINLSGMEWDVYHIVMPQSTSYDISGTYPLLPLNLTPGGNIDFTFAVSTHTTNSFFLSAKDNSQNLIASASARLYDDFGFEEVKFTGESENPDFGQILFSNLNAQIYHLEVTASGFFNYSGDFDILETTKGEINLTPE